MQSIGYIEVIGLSDAIMAGDRMLKAAAVSIKNIENAYGGYITVSVAGDVAAVEAAIEAGMSDDRLHIVSSDVIANPAEGIAELGTTDALQHNQLTTPKSVQSTVKRPPQVVPKAELATTKPTTNGPSVTKESATKSKPIRKETTKPTTKRKPAAKKAPSSRRSSSSQPPKRRPSGQSHPKNETDR